MFVSDVTPTHLQVTEVRFVVCVGNGSRGRRGGQRHPVLRALQLYGMRAILVFYPVTGPNAGLGIAEGSANAIYGVDNA